MPRSARKTLTTGQSNNSGGGHTSGQSSAINAGMILAKMCQNGNTKSNTVKHSIIINTNNCGTSGSPLTGQTMANNTVAIGQPSSGTAPVLQSSVKTPSILHSKATLQSHHSLFNIIEDNSSSNYSSILFDKSSSSPSSMSRSNAFASLIGAATNQFSQFNMDSIPPVPKRRKQDPKTGKGLRHFSMKVCEKVKLKGSTTYNEVADELVAEFSSDPIASRAAFQGGYLPGDQEPFDQKNIRRRVYDALNVLMAMNIISKEKKEIKWIGLPTNAAQECLELESEREKRMERINVKKQQLRDLLLQQIAFKQLVDRNKKMGSVPATNALISLPFIIVNTEKKTVIDCSISNDKTEYLFNFDNTFEIHDDIEVLKRMGLAFHFEKLDNEQTIERSALEKAKSILPEALRPELEEMIDEKNVKIVPISPRKSRIH